MDVRLNEEQHLIRQTVRDLVRDRIAPRARDIDATGEFPWDVVELFEKLVVPRHLLQKPAE